MNWVKVILFSIIALVAWCFISISLFLYRGGDIDEILYHDEKMAAKFYAQEQEKLIDKKIELLKRQLQSK
jgi:hypothetical protein